MKNSEQFFGKHLQATHVNIRRRLISSVFWDEYETRMALVDYLVSESSW